jgi:hypothetical protein
MRITAYTCDARELIKNKQQFEREAPDITYGEALFGSDDMYNT